MGVKGPPIVLGSRFCGTLHKADFDRGISWHSHIHYFRKPSALNYREHLFRIIVFIQIHPKNSIMRDSKIVSTRRSATGVFCL